MILSPSNYRPRLVKLSTQISLKRRVWEDREGTVTLTLHSRLLKTFQSEHYPSQPVLWTLFSAGNFTWPDLPLKLILITNPTPRQQLLNYRLWMITINMHIRILDMHLHLHIQYSVLQLQVCQSSRTRSGYLGPVILVLEHVPSTSSLNQSQDMSVKDLVIFVCANNC